MEYHYSFPRIQATGNTWHMLQKIQLLVGLEPTGSHNSPTATLITFNQELTTQQEQDLANLLLQPDIYDPGWPGFQITPDQCLYIDDIFDEEADFAAWLASIGVSGLDGLRWFVEKVQGSGNRNGIQITFNKVLTQPDKNKILNAYADGARFGGF